MEIEKVVLNTGVEWLLIGALTIWGNGIYAIPKSESRSMQREMRCKTKKRGKLSEIKKPQWRRLLFMYQEELKTICFELGYRKKSK